MSAKRFILPLLILAIGVAWLLNTAGFFAPVNWLWTGSLAVCGVCSFMFGKFTRAALVVGGFLLAAALTSLLRQTGVLTVEWEVPLLVVALGLLLFAAQFLPRQPAD